MHCLELQSIVLGFTRQINPTPLPPFRWRYRITDDLHSRSLFMAAGSKLTFKGDAKKKKKTKHSSRDPQASGSGSRPTKEAREGWISLDFAEQAHGPLYLVFPTTTDAEGVARPALCLAVNQTLASKTFPHVLTAEQSPDEPDDISHVVSADCWLRFMSFCMNHSWASTAPSVGLFKRPRIGRQDQSQGVQRPLSLCGQRRHCGLSKRSQRGSRRVPCAGSSLVARPIPVAVGHVRWHTGASLCLCRRHSLVV